MPSVELSFSTTKSGFVGFTPPFSYSVGTGSANCKVDRNTSTSHEKRALFNFPRGSLPENANIVSAELFMVIGSESAPDTPRAGFYLGQWIGATLDASAADYNGGTLVHADETDPYQNNIWILLDSEEADLNAVIPATGDIDLKIDDYSSHSGATWSVNFNTAKTFCKLRITWTEASATMTGRGTMSCSATATAEGAASASGRGTMSAAGTAIAEGASTATGRGTMSAAGTAIAEGSAELTGRGTMSAAATATADGSASATGLGMMSAAGTAIAEGSSDLTGRGTTSAAATATAEASATATGRGRMSATATAIADASAIMTGRGTMSAAAEPAGASVTMTGRGTMSCSAIAITPGVLARHHATRSLAVVHAATRVGAQVHAGTCSVPGGSSETRSTPAVHLAQAAAAPDDTHTRGKRWKED